MIDLPDFKNPFFYENNFYLSSDITRISKVLAHYELYKMVLNIPGVIVECGIFKGSSFIRFASFRELFENPFSKKIIGFDIFGKFPETEYEADKKYRQKCIEDGGDQSISRDQLIQVLDHKGLNKNIELIEGNVVKTIPDYLEAHPELVISLLHLDVDIYEPSVVILEKFYPRLVKGGVLILDDYGTFPGETKAVDDFFKDKKIKINKFPFNVTPSFIIKE